MYPRLLNHPEIKAQRAQRNEERQARLRTRFENGDNGVRRRFFILGSIVEKPNGLVIHSAEGLRFAYASTPIPGRIQESTEVEPPMVAIDNEVSLQESAADQLPITEIE